MANEWQKRFWRLVVPMLALFVVLGGCERAGTSGTSETETDRAELDSAEPTPTESDAEGASTGEERDWEQVVQQKLAEEGNAADDENDDATSAPSDSPSHRPCSLFSGDCPEGEACFSTGSGELRCASYNETRSPGDTCRAANDCNAGQQCVGGSPGTCRTACDPQAGDADCPIWAACTRVENARGELFDWGVCRSVEHGCTPWPNESCDPGDKCVLTSNGFRCRSYDPVAASGDTCPNGATDCNRGQICVKEGETFRCREKCSSEHPCSNGECADVTDREVGYCHLP